MKLRAPIDGPLASNVKLPFTIEMKMVLATVGNVVVLGLVLLEAFTFNFLSFFSEMDQVQIVRYLVKLDWQYVKHLWRLTKYVCILGPRYSLHT